MSEAVKTIATNRQAAFEYYLEQKTEAGIALTGSEVKSLRAGKVQLQDAFCKVDPDGVLRLYNAHINPYSHGGYANHEPNRPRDLLLHRREIEKFRKATEQKGYTIVPTRLYLKNGWVKIEVALGKGKKLYDKRDTVAERDTKRQIDRLMKNRG